MLSTTLIHVEDKDGKLMVSRVLLDSGSQSNIITENLAEKLKIKCKRQKELIGGINLLQTTTRKAVTIKIKSMHTNYEKILNCLLPHVTERIPQVVLNTKFLILSKEIKLADPTFWEPVPIDILIGAGVFSEIMSTQQGYGLPRLQNTLLGWIVGGELQETKGNSSKFCGVMTNEMLQMQFERFWEQEEANERRQLTREESECEKQFSKTFKQTPNGRFIVALP